MSIKLFLIGSMLAGAAWWWRARPGGSHLAVARLAGLLFSACWVVAVISPDSVTWVANRVGVGRGADLVLYALVVAFTFAALGQHKRLRMLDDRLAELTRANALLQHDFEALRDRAPGPHD